MLKQEARAIYRKKRDEITTLQKVKWDDLLLIQFQKLPLPPITSVLSFVPIDGKNEVDTFLITDYLQFKNPGMQVAYPKTDLQQQTMHAIALEEETVFEENEYKIAEPVNGPVLDAATLDVVLVPMLIFDESGNRIGYGKGFYDRFLKDCSSDCIKVGLCYFDAIDRIEDTTEYDVPLDYCITPNKVYVF
jgi:5-formyltetrahydrofolate cyclo-ligase